MKNYYYSSAINGVEAGALVRERTKVWIKEATCLLGSIQVLDANLFHKGSGALDRNKRLRAAIRTSGRSPVLPAKLTKMG